MTVPALETFELTKNFGGLRALDEVTLTLSQGERRGIIGPNGAGKTTLFRLISGELKPSKGRVGLFGEDITRLRAHHRARRGLGRTYQITNIFTQLTVRQNLELAAIQQEKISFALWWRRHDLITQRVNDVIEVTGLGKLAGASADEVSHGEQRQIELALALTTEPSILLLDEPAAGLSEAERADMAALIERLPREITICVIEHDMDFAFGVCEAITCLHYGKMIATGSPEEISSNEEVQAVYLGTREAFDVEG